MQKKDIAVLLVEEKMALSFAGWHPELHHGHFEMDALCERLNRKTLIHPGVFSFLHTRPSEPAAPELWGEATANSIIITLFMWVCVKSAQFKDHCAQTAPSSYSRHFWHAVHFDAQVDIEPQRLFSLFCFVLLLLMVNSCPFRRNLKESLQELG